jgi:hypothetical protein
MLLAAQAATASAGARPAPAAPHAAAFRLTIAGEIKNLGPAWISIGRVGCAIPGKLVASAGRFVVGDSVKISCLSGRLASIKYAPELATAQTSASNTSPPPPVVVVPGPSTGAIGAASISFGEIRFSPSGTVVTTSSSEPLSTVTGPITAFDTSGISVGDLGCRFRSFPSAPFPALQDLFHVGENVKLTCHTDTGQAAAISTVRP